MARPILPEVWPADPEAPTPLGDEIERVIHAFDRGDSRRHDLQALAEAVRKLERKRSPAWVTVCGSGRQMSGWTLGKRDTEALPSANVKAIREDFENECGLLSFEFREEPV